MKLRVNPYSIAYSIGIRHLDFNRKRPIIGGLCLAPIGGATIGGSG